MDWRQRDSTSSSERISDSGSRSRITTRRGSSPAVRLPLEDVPRVLAFYWLDAPASWFRPTSRFSNGGTRSYSDQVTFLRLAAATEFDPNAVRTRRALALTRFFTPTALPTHRDPPFPGFTYPGHVASLHLPCASTLYSLGELPGVLSTRCAHGMRALQSLT